MFDSINSELDKIMKKLDNFREIARKLIIEVFPNYSDQLELAVLEENIAKALLSTYRSAITDGFYSSERLVLQVRKAELEESKLEEKRDDYYRSLEEE